MDGNELIDDVIACRAAHNDQPAVEICAHGGVRVVERILSLLEKLGATFDEGAKTAAQAWTPHNAIEAEALEAMTAAKTERALALSAFSTSSLHLCKPRASNACPRLEAAG
jgi:tRNA U34 5-carboxymethylaminomethyl modifying GTPase MnmE/TrmE